MSPATASICAMTRSAGIACQAVTPSVFCAVTAVIADRAVDADARRTSSGRPGCRRRRPSRCPQLSVLCAYSKIPSRYDDPSGSVRRHDAARHVSHAAAIRRSRSASLPCCS